jgi:hypothetical protein
MLYRGCGIDREQSFSGLAHCVDIVESQLPSSDRCGWDSRRMATSLGSGGFRAVA